MSLGKAFGFSLLAFIGVNAAFFLLAYGVGGILIAYFQGLATNPSGIIYMFVGPIMSAGGPQFPALMYTQFTIWITGGLVIPGELILFIGYIVAPFLAAFLSGRFGEDKKEMFLGYFLTIMIVAIVVMIFVIIEGILFSVAIPLLIATAFGPIAVGLVYALAFGCIALLIGREF